MTYKVTIIKHGRVWTQLSIQYSTGRTGKAKIKKDSVKDLEEGTTVDLEGYIDRHDNGYGSDPELILQTKEDKNKKEAERWWGYFLENAKKGWIYDRAIEEIHNLGIHDYDKEIEKTTYQLEEARWWDGLLSGQSKARADL